MRQRNAISTRHLRLFCYVGRSIAVLLNIDDDQPAVCYKRKYGELDGRPGKDVRRASHCPEPVPVHGVYGKVAGRHSVFVGLIGGDRSVGLRRYAPKEVRKLSSKWLARVPP